MIIFLLGMPASGKTSTGKRLAKKTRLPFIDLDHYITAAENRSIPVIFKEDGEGRFRELESKYLNELVEKNSSCILSLGGGTPCFSSNIDFIRAKGKSIYLQCPADLLVARLQENPSRPLLAGLDELALKNKIHTLLREREPYYIQADHIINTAHKSDKDLLDELQALIL